MAAYGTRLQATADKSLWLLTLVPLRDRLQLKRQGFGGPILANVSGRQRCIRLVQPLTLDRSTREDAFYELAVTNDECAGHKHMHDPF